jgi:hypothetical protein
METTKKAMNSLAKHADLFLLLFALLSFVLLIIFKTDYYLHIFSPRFGTKLGIAVAVASAILVEGVRFSLLVASASDAINKNSKGLWLGIVASILITIYDLTICIEIGNVWGSYVHSHILQVFVVLGLLLEIRLVLMVVNKDSMGNGNHQQNQQPVKTHTYFRNMNQHNQVP